MRTQVTDKKTVAAVWAALGNPAETVPTSLAVTVAKEQELRPCADGCGQLTSGTWVPGHDAKHKSRLFALVRGTDPAQADLARKELIARGWPLPVIKAEPAPLPTSK